MADLRVQVYDGVTFILEDGVVTDRLDTLGADAPYCAEMRAREQIEAMRERDEEERTWR